MNNSNRLVLLVFLFLITSLFTSCRTVEFNPTENSFIHPSATPFSTITITPSPVPSPTITTTPLPNKPDGGQNFDPTRSLWTKTENNTIFYYIHEASSWTTALNQKPIYLIDFKNYTSDVAKALPKNYKAMRLFFYRTIDSEEPFYSVEEPIEYDLGWFGETFDLDPAMVSSPHELLLMALAERMNVVQEEELTAQMLQDILTKIADRSLILALDVPLVARKNDQTTTKYWDPNNNIDIVQVPWATAIADSSFFGQTIYNHRWKLDVRGGKDKEHPGNLVVFFAVPYPNKFKRDYSEANLTLLGPIYIAVQSQEEPIDGEAVFYSPVQDFASSASLSAWFDGSSPFLEYKCSNAHTQEILYCYAPAQYLLRKNP